MTGRLAQAIALDAALAVASLGYLFSPTVYAYFSEVGLSYSEVPRWFADTLPAHVTVRMFDRFNVDAPRAARFSAHLSCVLSDEGAQRLPGCAHRINGGAIVHGPESLKLASGSYLASFQFDGDDRCSHADARVAVTTTGRFGRVLSEYAGDVQRGERIELPFRLKPADAAFGAVEFRMSGRSGCVLLTRVNWSSR